ncbi:DEKNAAC101811 [Brettanomyces naardenensis]|uniref:DEKNAAC101811 n=1 Tax=Brettanomyces naardenensis TaxID=13370 RepID=A0A448YJD5_BRENA|nr:DEKNAAC101811 [Brettanomyces naardenensis]
MSATQSSDSDASKRRDNLDEGKEFLKISPEESTFPLKDEMLLNDSEDVGVIHEARVKRGLKTRQITMIALGGTIGTGLFIGTSAPLHQAGPVNALIAYLFFGVLAYFVTQSLGEMATHTPIAGSFCVFNTKYLSRSIGLSTNWLYWFQWPITFAVELFAIAQVIEYWTDKVPNWAWMLIFFVILTTANFFPVGFYGEVEFWVALVKVLAIMGFIIYALCMVCGAGKQGPIGFRYWRNPGPWGAGAGLVSNVNTDRFLGWLSSLINAAFTYQGVEFTGISAGESANPRKSVPKAINKVIFRILLFYILTLFFMGLLVPYNDPNLTNDTTFISSSPFLISIQNCGTPILPDIFNAVMLCTIISAGNSDIYIGSRVLYAMAGTTAPSIFRRTTKQGVPYIGVIVSSSLGLLAFLNISNSGQTVFNWLMDISAVAGMIDWIFISLAHLRFQAILKSRNISRDTLPYKATGMPFFAWFTAISLTIITFVQGYTVFFNFSVADFFADYISLILFFAIWFGSQFTLYRKDSWLVPIDQVDILSEARKIDEEVWDDEDEEKGFMGKCREWSSKQGKGVQRVLNCIDSL